MSNIIIFYHLFKLRFLSYIKSLNFGTSVFIFFCFLVSVLIMSSTFLLSTSQGASFGINLLHSNNKITKTNHKDSKNTFKNTVSNDNKEEIKENSFIKLIKQKKITKNSLTLFLKSPKKLSKEQRIILQKQDIVIKEWNNLHNVPNKINNIKYQYFIWAKYNNKFKDWTLLTSEVNTQKNNNQLTNIEIVKLILWLPEIKKQGKWKIDHPDPKMPKNLLLSYINIHVIPDTLSIKIIFWIAVVFSALFFSASIMVLSLSHWESIRKEGLFQPLMTIPFKTEILVWSYTALRMCNTTILLTLSYIVFLIFMIILNVNIPFWDTLKALCLFILVSSLSISLVTCIASWYNTKWWRICTSIVINIFAISIEISYISFVSFNKDYILYLDRWFFYVFCLILMGMIYILNKTTAIRLDKKHRSGFIKNGNI